MNTGFNIRTGRRSDPGIIVQQEGDEGISGNSTRRIIGIRHRAWKALLLSLLRYWYIRLIPLVDRKLSFLALAVDELDDSLFRTTCLDRILFGSLTEARVLINYWLEEYDTIRPHGSLGGISPEQFLQRRTDGKMNQQLKSLTV